MTEVVARWRRPSADDKTDDETWVEYQDRKRHEIHETGHQCVVCRLEDVIHPLDGERLVEGLPDRWEVESDAR